MAERTQKKMTFGLIIGTRTFFPGEIAEQTRRKAIAVMEDNGYDVVIPPAEATHNGALSTDSDAEVYIDLFRKHQYRIDGIVIVLANFGEELIISDTIDRAGINKPVLVQACADRKSELDVSRRRDSFCGKISLCNNLHYRNIPFTNTSKHVYPIESDLFVDDLKKFSAVCRVVGGLKNLRVGLIGQRPNAFNTMRFSERILQQYGITVLNIDLMEVIHRAESLADAVSLNDEIDHMRNYGTIDPDAPEESIRKAAGFSQALKAVVKENRLDTYAFECWDSLQKYFGCSACLAMSDTGENDQVPGACEADVLGAVSMYALQLAGEDASALLDWNNNYEDNDDTCIVFHCSNIPKSFFKNNITIGTHEILKNTFGKEQCFGVVSGVLKEGPITYLRLTTDDKKGVLKAYVGEGDLLEADDIASFGGYGLLRIGNLEGLMNHIVRGGFEHHVAINRSRTADILNEAFTVYAGFPVYRHS